MRGMYAKKDLKKDEMLLFVPEHLVVTLDKAESTPMGKTWWGMRDLMTPVTDLLAVHNL